MNDSTRTTIEQVAEATHQGLIHFGEVLGRLGAAGVEAYHVDYRGQTTTYHLADDSTLQRALPTPAEPIATEFDAAALLAAIRGAQRGEVMYPQFLRLSRAAGCVGYSVWLRGRHVCYFGRLGQQHIERFPD